MKRRNAFEGWNETDNSDMCNMDGIRQYGRYEKEGYEIKKDGIILLELVEG